MPVTLASGPNAAKPHTELSDRRIEPGETLLRRRGLRRRRLLLRLHADLPRPEASPDELKHAYEVCLDAQLAALEAVRTALGGLESTRPRATGIAAAGYGEAFGHGLGHGIGLVVHEDPRLAQESRSVLEAATSSPSNPASTCPALGGIRIEDLVVVTDGEPEVLTTFPKELRVLD